MIHADQEAALAAANIHVVNPYEQALKLINENSYGVTKAARAVGIPKTNLKRWLAKKKVNPTISAAPKRGAPKALTDATEKAIVETLVMLSRRGCGLPVKMLKQKVAIICSDGRDVPFNAAKGPGKKWFNLFFKRLSPYL